jgi:hypothetical protein
MASCANAMTQFKPAAFNRVSQTASLRNRAAVSALNIPVKHILIKFYSFVLQIKKAKTRIWKQF